MVDDLDAFTRELRTALGTTKWQVINILYVITSFLFPKLKVSDIPTSYVDNYDTDTDLF